MPSSCFNLKLKTLDMKTQTRFLQHFPVGYLQSKNLSHVLLKPHPDPEVKQGGKCTSFSEHHLCIKPCISHCQSGPCPVDVHSPVLGAAVLVLLFLSSRNRAQGGNFPEITPLFNNAVYLILNKRLLCFGALS